MHLWLSIRAPPRSFPRFAPAIYYINQMKQNKNQHAQERERSEEEEMYEQISPLPIGRGSKFSKLIDIHHVATWHDVCHSLTQSWCIASTKRHDLSGVSCLTYNIIDPPPPYLMGGVPFSSLSEKPEIPLFALLDILTSNALCRRVQKERFFVIFGSKTRFIPLS